MRVSPSESDIVASVCEYLAARRHFFFRSNNLPVFDKSREAFRAMPRFAMKGVPDIIVIKGGRFVGLECKTQKGRQSPEQKAFEEGSRTAGADYFVVRSIEDVQRIDL